MSVTAEDASSAAAEDATAADNNDVDELVIRNLELARSIARRFRNRGETDEDLDQVAFVGLVNAARRFDHTRGTAFCTFAVPNILGELKRHFRKRWMLKVARAQQEAYLAVRDTFDEVTLELGRVPTPAELSRRTGLSESVVVQAQYAAGAFRPESLDYDDGDRPKRVSHVPIADDRSDAVVDTLFVRRVASRMSDRDRLVMQLRFGEGLSQSQIGREIGVSQMQISRILGRVLSEIKRQLGEEEAERANRRPMRR
jgi:RNA polymerase sigma-B factor